MAGIHVAQDHCAVDRRENLRVPIRLGLSWQGGDLFPGQSQSQQSLSRRVRHPTLLVLLRRDRFLLDQGHIFPLRRQQHRTVERRQRLARGYLGSVMIDEQFVNPAVEVGG